MKKLSSILLIITMLIAMLSLTSCSSENKVEINTYEDLVRFIFGDSPAAEFFVNFKPFSTTKSICEGLGNLFKTIKDTASVVWNRTVSFFTKLAEKPILLILAIIPSLIVFIFAALIIILIAFITAIIFAFSLFVSVVYDALFLLLYGCTLVGMACVRYLIYVLIDLGWGERLIKNFKKYKDLSI